MTTTKNKNFSPSVNIVRDFEKELTYFPTPNTQHTFSQITNDFILGISSFCIVGSYGTGKSSFLWAFEKVLNHKKDFFERNDFYDKFNEFVSVNLVGDFSSLIVAFANEFNVKGNYTTTSIIKKIDSYYKKLEKKDNGLIIYIDEFGKFLEYAAKTNPEQELYFAQQIAEYVNDSNKNIFLVTTLHQDFNSYSFGLKKNQRNEWSKVKGRFKDIPFNEPVEQLLFLASERLEHFPNKQKKEKEFKKLLSAIKASKTFPLRDYLNEDIAEKLLPFDILAASLLTISLQRYAQNERSLFSFIESDDFMGINHFDYEKPYFSIPFVYDYLHHNFAILNTKNNPHYNQWLAIQIAIERVEGSLEALRDEGIAMIKTIGLLNIFASASAKIDDNFLDIYGKYSLDIKSPQKIIKALSKHKIIRYAKYSHRYILFEGTDLDIDLAIDQAGNIIERVSNVTHYLTQYFEFPYVMAKASYYKYGTPRFFEFIMSETPIEETPIGEIDGFVNLIFSENQSIAKLKTVSKKCDKAILFGWYKNTQEIRNLIFEINKVKKVIETTEREDRVAHRELQKILSAQVRLLNHYVLDTIYSGDGNVRWVFEGQELSIKSEKVFNRELSVICEKIYFKAPTFKSELVNKTKLSGAINMARKKLNKAMIGYWDKPDLGFPENKFPPEKSIYLSLLKETQIIKEDNGLFDFYEPSDKSFIPLWKECISFLNKSRTGKRNLRELSDTLLNKPFKLKKGFIDFWLPIFLFANREDFALFSKDQYLPEITDQTLELVVKNPHNYYIKAFDVEGINLKLFKMYRKLLDQKESYPSNQGFIETVKPFLVFYKSLNEYSKNTQRLPKSALSLRKAIAKAKDPEKTFFEDFPKALGYSRAKLSKNTKLLDRYIDELRGSLKSIRIAYEELLDRFELSIVEFLSLEGKDFKVYQEFLKKRFEYVKPHFLKQKQKVFLQRIVVDLERNSWLSAICQACIGKNLANINDEDEPFLFDRFVEMVQELDSLQELSKAKEIGDDELFGIDITTVEKGQSKYIIRLPKKKKTKINKQISKIESILGKEDDVNLAVLATIMNKILNND